MPLVGRCVVGRAVAAFTSMEVPFLLSDFERVFVPEGNRYVNDHCLLRAPDGTWHLFAIAHVAPEAGPTDPRKERSLLLHATAPSLFGPWTEQTRRPRGRRAPGRARCLGSLRRPGRVLERTRCTTGRRRSGRPWVRGRPTASTCSTGIAWRRCLTSHSDREVVEIPSSSRWAPGGCSIPPYSPWGLVSSGQIVVSVSSDISDPKGWSDHGVVIQDDEPLSAHRFLESPTVFERNGVYYLFLCRIGPDEPREYLRTLVFRSPDPFRFDFGHAHRRVPRHTPPRSCEARKASSS